MRIVFLREAAELALNSLSKETREMGTSGSSSGPNSNSALVPTWVDEPGTTVPLPDGTEDQGNQHDASPRPAIEPAPLPARFRGARRNFTAFAKSGGNNQGSLRRAVRDYVRLGSWWKW